MKKAVVFGAGNIGRSFITPVLQGAGYKVTIVDLDENLVRLLDLKKEYRISICGREELQDIYIRDYKALALNDLPDVEASLAAADLVSSSVGLKGFQGVCRLVGRSLPSRKVENGRRPLDFILAENIHGGSDLCRKILFKELGHDFPVQESLGIVETSIGKMVPYPSDEMRKEDPLRLLAEPYNELILDRDGFLGTPPVKAYVDRKLYIHNLGHVAAAYLGRLYHPDLKMIWEVLEDETVLGKVRTAMMLSASALAMEYPDSYTIEGLTLHVDDLIDRFRNKTLGDPVQRVGRDLRRKLSFDDRICGAANMVLKHSLRADIFSEIFSAAAEFGNHPDADDQDRRISADAGRNGTGWLFDECSRREGEDTRLKSVFVQQGKP